MALMIANFETKTTLKEDECSYLIQNNHLVFKFFIMLMLTLPFVLICHGFVVLYKDNFPNVLKVSDVKM